MNEDIRAELHKYTTDVSFTMLYTVTGEDTAMVKTDQLIDCARFSNYLSLLQATAFILRFIMI